MFNMKIDYSQLQCYMDCPRRYYNRYILCLRKRGYDERDIDREFGKCFHKALEIWYKEGNLEKAQGVYRTDFAAIETEKAKTPANGEKLVEAYQNYWAQPVNELSDTNLETVAVEVTDSFKLADDVEYIVKIDRIVKNRAGTWVFETKTTSKMAYNYFQRFDPNSQISGYCDYVQRKYGQCSGAIINVAGIGFRQKSYKGEPAGFHCEFGRDIVNRNESQLIDWRANALHWARRLAQDIKTDLGLGVFRKNESACHQFKGCGFKELCRSLDDEQVKEVMYETYNPTEYLEDKVTETI